MTLSITGKKSLAAGKAAAVAALPMKRHGRWMTLIVSKKAMA